MIGDRVLRFPAARQQGRIRPAHQTLSLGIRPLSWPATAPVAAATALISLSILLYVLQVNQVSVLEFNLAQAQQEHAQLLDTNTQLVVQAAQLTAMERVQAIATQKFHMIKPDLSHTVWINVQLPRTTPRLPRVAPVVTDPLSWMQSVAHTLWSGL